MAVTSTVSLTRPSKVCSFYCYGESLYLTVAMAYSILLQDCYGTIDASVRSFSSRKSHAYWAILAGSDRLHPPCSSCMASVRRRCRLHFGSGLAVQMLVDSQISSRNDLHYWTLVVRSLPSSSQS